ncbi:MAG: mechanosensitive ion channel family protein [Nitrospinae bacterium]|nr:mechanosensitive ion channel family protein [Nitrospinota bacterium]
MKILTTGFWGNPVKDWLLSLIIAFAVFAALLLLRQKVSKKLARLAGRIKQETGTIFEGLREQTKTFFLLVLAGYAGSLNLDLSRSLEVKINQLLILVVLLQAGIWLGWLISFWVNETIKGKKEEDPAGATTIGALGFLLRLALWGAVLLLALDNLGFNITALVAGLGVGGIAVALAVQNILGDLFASLTIVIDKPFVIGDFIVVEDFMGTVEHIGLKTTSVRSLSGEQIVFPNSNLLQSRVRNYKRMTERRMVFSIGVVYQTPAGKLKAIPEMIREIVESQQGVRFDRSHFKEYGDSSLSFETVYYVLSPDYNVFMDTQQSVNLAIFERFEKEKIEFAYPTRTVFVTPQNP